MAENGQNLDSSMINFDEGNMMSNNMLVVNDAMDRSLVAFDQMQQDEYQDGVNTSIIQLDQVVKSEIQTEIIDDMHDGDLNNKSVVEFTESDNHFEANRVDTSIIQQENKVSERNEISENTEQQIS